MLYHNIQNHMQSNQIRSHHSQKNRQLYHQLYHHQYHLNHHIVLQYNRHHLSHNNISLHHIVDHCNLEIHRQSKLLSSIHQIHHNLELIICTFTWSRTIFRTCFISFIACTISITTFCWTITRTITS